MILFNDFTSHYKEIKQEIDSAVQRVLSSGWYLLSNELSALEEVLAKYLGVNYCVGVGSGTDAIQLVLMANDVGKDDEVITTNMTAFQTLIGIMQAGAIPVVVDINANDGLIDVSKIETKINKKTKAVIPVHLYGQACQMDEIKAICQYHHLLLIEDNAQAIGATYKGRKTGSIGDCSILSFYPSKNLGAFGDAGAVATNDKIVYEKLLSLRNYGQKEKYVFENHGINSRMDEIQAAILRVKMKYIDTWNEKRRDVAAFYRSEIKTPGFLEEHGYGQTNYHQFVIKTADRDELAAHLRQNEIQTLIHYPMVANRQKAFPYQKNEILAVSEKFAKEILSLPIYPEIDPKHLDKIVNTINQFYG